MLNHRANSPCRCCLCCKENLLDFPPLGFEPKSQSKIVENLKKCLPLLAVRGNKGRVANTLNLYGLKVKIPVRIQVPSNHLFDLCTHSVTCLMHNEELGLMVLELEGFLNLFTTAEKDSIIGKSIYACVCVCMLCDCVYAVLCIE